MQKFILIAVAGMALSSHAVAEEVVLSGTYKLVSEQRTIVDTGEVISATNSRGYISYDVDGRMMVLIVRNPRPKPEGAEKNHGSTANRSIPDDNSICRDL